MDEHITGLQWCGKLMLINEGGVCGPGYPASFAATWHHLQCLSVRLLNGRVYVNDFAIKTLKWLIPWIAEGL